MTDNNIIRCRDCEFYKKNRYAETGWCEKAFMEIDISEEDFCSRAEIRKPETSVYVEEKKAVAEIPVKPSEERRRGFVLGPNSHNWEDYCSMNTRCTGRSIDRMRQERLDRFAVGDFARELYSAASIAGMSMESLANVLRDARPTDSSCVNGGDD